MESITLSANTVILFVILVCVLMYQLYKKPSDLKIVEHMVRKQMLTMNYEKDMEYLVSIVNYHIDRSITLVIKPKIASNIGSNVGGLITDEILSEECSRILKSVLDLVSPSYRSVMSKYYTPEKIDEYIADFIYTEMSLTAMKHNLSVANRKGIMNHANAQEQHSKD